MDKEIHPYFPVTPHFKESKYRSIFKSYGSVQGIDVVRNDHGILQTVCQRNSKACLNLCASQPTLPFSDPNTDSFIKEPCMTPILENRELLRYKCKSAKEFIQYATKNRSNRKLKRDLTLVYSRICRVINSLESGKLKEGEDLEMELEDLFMGTGSDIQKFTQEVDEILANDATIHKVNALYTGGNMKYMPWNSQQKTDGVLGYCSGENLSSLNIVDIQMKVDNPVEKSKASFMLEEPIYQVDCTAATDHVLFLTRHNDCTNLLKVQAGSNNDAPTLEIAHLEKTHSMDQLSNIALSPYLSGEYIVTTQKGTVKLHRPDNKSSVVAECEHRFTCAEPVWYPQWGMHPREITITDRTGMALYDIRSPCINKPSVDVFSLPHSTLRKNERVYVSKTHSVKTNYHILATDYSIILADQRFPNHPVLNWTHLMSSPPVYIDICTDVCFTREEQQVPHDVILMGTQESSELHCMEFTTRNYPGNTPAWTDVPWRVSRKDDMVSLLWNEGIVFNPTIVEKRLSIPLTGVAGIHHGNGFIAMQVTSLGDLFYQSYKKESNFVKEKTYSFGPGCKDLKLSKGNIELCSSWLAKSEKLLNTCQSDILPVPIIASVSEHLKALSVSEDVSHVLCSLCRSQQRISVEQNHTCFTCNSNLKSSQALVRQVNEGKPITLRDDDEVTAGLEELDDCLLSLKPNAAEHDAYSDILLRLWNDEKLTEDVLLKREKEWRERYKTQHKKNKGKKHKKLSTSRLQSDEETSSIEEDDNEDIDTEVKKSDKLKENTSLFSMLGISHLSQPSQSSTKKQSIISDFDKVVIKSEDEGSISSSNIETPVTKYSDKEDQKYESDVSDSLCVRKISFLRDNIEPGKQLPSAKRKRTSSLSSQCSSKSRSKSSGLLDSSHRSGLSLEGFANTPPRLKLVLQKCDDAIVCSSEELGIVSDSVEARKHFKKSAVDKEFDVITSTSGISYTLSPSHESARSLLSNINRTLLQGKSPAKKKKHSYMGF